MTNKEIAYMIIKKLLSVTMPKFLRNFIRGAGSVLSLDPYHRTRDYLAYFPRSPQEALQGDWKRVGGYLYSAYNKATNEPKEEQK